MQKKRFLTLIEVCLALGLAAIVISFLFSGLLQTVRASRALAKIKDHAIENSFCYARLLPIFSHADPTKIEIDEEMLHLSFENGLDPHLIFSGKTKADLSLQNETVILAIHSRDDSQVRREALFTHVEWLTWEENLPYFLTLHIKQKEASPRQFVFFFTDHPEGYPL